MSNELIVAAAVAAGLWLLAGATGGDEAPRSRPAGPIIRQGPVSIRLRERGALLMDAFDGGKIDTRRWRIWKQDPDQVNFTLEDGRFVIRGVGQLAHNGLWSLNAARFKDVMLAARMDIRSPGVGKPHELYLHLCGGDMPRSPDHWVEIGMQDLGDKAQFRVMAAVEKGNFRQADRKLVLDRGKEDGFVARLSLDGSTNRCLAEVRDAKGVWHAVTDPVPLRLRTTHCEIKMRRQWAGDEDDSAASTGWFDDVRIYPRAEANPVLVRLVRPDGSPIFQRDGESWPPKIQLAGQDPRSLEDLTVELLTADGKTRICAVQSPHFAHYMLPLKNAPWDLYPVAAKVRLLLDGKSLGEVEIRQEGLVGLYPDDVYDVVVR